MAKRKHAAALFEVFNDNRGRTREKPALSRSSGWWFKPRMSGSSAGAAVIDPNDPTTMPIKSSLIAPRIAAVEAMEPPASKCPTSPAPAPRPDAKVTSPTGGESAPALTRTEAAAIPAPTQRFHLDLEAQEVTIRLPVRIAAVTCFGIFLAFALAFVMGRRIGSASRAIPKETPSLVTTDDIWSQPVRPAALDVPKRTTTPAKSPTQVLPTPRVATDARTHDHDSLPMANSVKDLVPLPKAAVPDDGPRMIGLNYMLVQTYPNQALATEARDFLMKSGISCTVEKAPAGFAVDPSWYAVISTKGFEHIHTPECDNLKHQIEKAGEKFAGNGKFKRFAPQLFKLK